MVIETLEIPRADWAEALAAFSAAHEGWLVSVEILSAELGAQPQITGMPLTAVMFEEHNGGAIVITVGRGADAHLAHVIRAPTHVRIERTAAGADVALEIEAADGTRAVLRFRAVALPETVDGIAHRP